MSRVPVKMTINGRAVEALIEPRTLLIHFLREQAGLTGAHIGCDTSHCGACTVDLNAMSVKSCTVFAIQANGAEIVTIEGWRRQMAPCMRCRTAFARCMACNAAIARQA